MINYLLDERGSWISKLYLLLWALTVTIALGTGIAFRTEREAPSPVGRVTVSWPPLQSEPRLQRLSELDSRRLTPPSRIKVRAPGSVALEGEPLRR